MIIVNKNGQYSYDELALLNKVICGSLTKNIIQLLNGTESKFKIVDNCAEEKKHLPKGYITEVYNKSNELMFQSVQRNVEA